MSKTVTAGVYADQRLNFVVKGEGSLTKDQGFKPYLRNSAVRHYRGASGNVTLVELWCAGINRHEVGDERALRERVSDPLGLEFCARFLSRGRPRCVNRG
jgi:hypothetical protein